MTHDDLHDHQVEAHDLGLSHDLPTLLSRRRALALLGGAGLAAALAGCGVAGGSDGADSAAGSPTIGSPSASSAAASDGSGIPEETAGPYPGDGSNEVNVLTESGIAQRHHPQLRIGVGGGRGRAPDHQAHGARHRQRRRPAAGRRRLPVAL
jgi:hypothetical protein